MNHGKTNVEILKERYPEGTGICLDEMEGEPQMPAGLKGKVFVVDDMGQIHLEWENGSTLALVPGVDKFHKIESPGKNKEVPSR